MSHIAVGKLLPNLKVTVGNEETVENSDDCMAEMLNLNSDGHDVEIVRSWMNSLQNPKVYKNKSGAFATGLDLISESNSEKLGKRAERFGIEIEESSISESILSLYKSMGVDIKNKNSAKMKNMRLDALHMRGINDLNTNEVFQYFQDYGPASVEWINDFSCNVVWLDETTCARALLGISKPLQVSAKKTDSTQTDSDETSEALFDPVVSDTSLKEVEKIEETDENPSLDIPVPPGSWRLAIPHPKAKSILLRFSTKDDKKLPGAEKRSSFYQKYGNPNYGGLTGLISGSRKRKLLAATNKRAIESSKSQPSEDSHSKEDISPHKSRVPRMRMYADDEEMKTMKSQFYDTESVHSRLGAKYTREDLCHLGVQSSDRFSGRLNRGVHSSDTLAGRLDIRIRSSDRLTDRKSQGSDGSWVDFSPRVDLRKKIKKLQTDSNVRKHRSPLCVED